MYVKIDATNNYNISKRRNVLIIIMVEGYDF